MNASKQGVPANQVVLPGEDADQYQSRLKAWAGQLEPEGPVELYLVQRAVQLSWQLDRADRCQVARLGHQGRPDANDPAPAETTAIADRLAFDDSDAGERLRKHQLACGRMLIRTLDAFATLRLAFFEARGGVAPPARNESCEQEETATCSCTPNQTAAIAMVEAAESSNSPAHPHSLIEEILAGIQARPSQVESPSIPVAPVGRDVLAAGRADDAPRIGSSPAAPAASPRIDRAPIADRVEVRSGPRSSQFPRVAAREANQSGWPGHRDMEERPANSPHPRNGPVRRASPGTESGPNEPGPRRRVGGYEVPLDTWVPVTGADRAPVRLRRREARDVSPPSTGCTPA